MLRRLLFHNFRYLYAVDRWVRRRFTPAGKLLLAGLGASALFGIDTRQTLTYQAFGFLLALLVVAIANSRYPRWPVTARRQLPDFATVGEPVRYRVHLNNLSGRAQHALYVTEILDFALPSFQELYTSREPGEEKRNWFDRVVGYPRWLWLIARKAGAVVNETPVPTLLPHGANGADLELLPTRRGYVHLGALGVSRPDPLGLFKSVKTIPMPDRLLVLPRRYPVQALRLTGRRHYQAGGIALASPVGDSQEFVSLRDYRPGDPLRHIHWRSWARTGRPIIKQFREEFVVRHALLLDTFLEDRDEQVLEAGVSVAASLACAPRQPDSLLDLMFVGRAAYSFPSGRGLAPTERMLEVLASVTPAEGRSLEPLELLVREHAASLSACVCILLGWQAQRQGLVALLQALGVPVMAIVVTSETADAPLPPGPLVGRPEHLRTIRAGHLAEDLAKL